MILKSRYVLVLWNLLISVFAFESIKLKRRSLISSVDSSHRFLDQRYLGTDPFTIEVNYGNESSTTIMGISLSSSRSFLNQNCSTDFQPFICQADLGCIVDTKSSGKVSFPFTDISGTLATLPLKIGDGWANNFTDNLILATDCNLTYKENGIAGVVGFGAVGSAYENFNLEFGSFSIYIPSDVSEGELVFGSDNPFPLQSNPQILLADANWTLTLNSLAIGNDSINLSSKGIFDLSFKSIGVNQSIFEFIIENLNDAGCNCTYNPDSINFLCSLETSFSNLPSIAINLQPNNVFTIPPSVYLVTANINSLYNLQFTNTSSLVTMFYSDYVILGIPILQEFYTTFQLPLEIDDSFQVILNLQSQTFNDVAVAFFIIGGLVLFFAVVFICIYLKRRFSHKTEIESDSTVDKNLQRNLRLFTIKEIVEENSDFGSFKKGDESFPTSLQTSLQGSAVKEARK